MFKFFMPDRIYKDIYEIDFDDLQGQNIKGLIFDIDNTLVSYKQEKASSELIEYMNILVGKGFQVCFISNNKNERVELFNNDFNFFCCANAKKPSIKSFHKVVEKFNLPVRNIAVIGDQLFTDIFAAKRIKMHAVLVSPIEPVETLFFKLKRVGEKPFIRAYHKRAKKKG